MEIKLAKGLNKAREIFVALACIWTTFSAVVLAAFVVALNTGAFHQNRAPVDFGNASPPQSWSLNDICPDNLQNIAGSFLRASASENRLDSAGYIMILIPLDSARPKSSDSCIIMGDAFEYCGCGEDKIRVCRYLLKNKANGDSWEAIRPTTVTLSEYFQP